jgi:hypothetical protein
VKLFDSEGNPTNPDIISRKQLFAAVAQLIPKMPSRQAGYVDPHQQVPCTHTSSHCHVNSAPFPLSSLLTFFAKFFLFLSRQHWAQLRQRSLARSRKTPPAQTRRRRAKSDVWTFENKYFF